jgi:membrane protein
VGSFTEGVVRRARAVTDRRHVRSTVELASTTYRSWRADRTIRLGAGLAYYGLFSLASVFTLTLGLIRAIGNRTDVEEFLTEQFVELLGDVGIDVAAEVNTALDGAGAPSLGVVGLVSLFVTGSLFFLALEDALNQIWGVPVSAGIWTTIRRRATAFLVLLAAAATLVLSFAVQAIAVIAEAILPGSPERVDAIGTLLANGLSWAVLAAAVVLVFRYLPAVQVGWRAVLVGGITTSALLILGTAVIGWYLRTYGATSVTGAAASVLAVLAWIYYEAQIVLVGAQFTKALDGRRAQRSELGSTRDAGT